ncbi:MAG: hypothetical protein CMJ78_11360 [Planctomycetaceae bacterium]|nr:hypothetical protein [Planctomycetaceae bacterium]
MGNDVEQSEAKVEHDRSRSNLIPAVCLVVLVSVALIFIAGSSNRGNSRSAWQSVFPNDFPCTADQRTLIRNPLTTTITQHQNGSITSTRETYSVGEYGTTDFGKIRLAIRGSSFSGRSKSSVVLSSNETYSTSRSSTGTGKRKFTAQRIDGGTECTFGGLIFQFVDGKLLLCGQEFDAADKPTLIIVNESKQIESVALIP